MAPFDRPVRVPSLAERLDQLAGSAVPGLQYVVVRAGGAVFEYAGGWSDIRRQRPMTAATTLMAYSMTKTFTAAAILQRVEQGLLALDHTIDAYLSDAPYPAAASARWSWRTAASSIRPSS
jgi:D-alanyl-D-alanine carboxypeptidase